MSDMILWRINRPRFDAWRDQYLTPIFKLEESIAPLRSCDEFAEKILVFMQELILKTK